MKRRLISMLDLQVVVLMGGPGTRLRASTVGPKAMVDVHGKPFFLYQFDRLKHLGIQEFIFCIGYAGQTVRNYFGDGSAFSTSIRYSEDEPSLLGTGGALRKALPLLREFFMVLYGDSYSCVDYSELLRTYLKQRSEGSGAQGLMTLFKNQNRWDSSNAVFKEGRLLKYDKKNKTPDMEYIDHGAIFLERSALDRQPKGAWDLGDWCHQMVEEGTLAGFEVHERFYEVGTPESLEEFRKFVAKRQISA